MRELTLPPTPIVAEPMIESRNEVLPLDGVVWLMNDSNVAVSRWNRHVGVHTSQQKRTQARNRVAVDVTRARAVENKIQYVERTRGLHQRGRVVARWSALVKRPVAVQFTGRASAGEAAAMSNAAPAAIIRSFVRRSYSR